MKTTRRYPKEVRERAVRMVFGHREEYNSEWATMRSIASKFGMTRGALRIWVRRVFNENYSVYGARKVWRQLHREVTAWPDARWSGSCALWRWRFGAGRVTSKDSCTTVTEEHVEFATLEWGDWFNHRRLFESIGNIPPAEREEICYATLTEEEEEGHGANESPVNPGRFNQGAPFLLTELTKKAVLEMSPRLLPPPPRLLPPPPTPLRATI